MQTVLIEQARNGDREAFNKLAALEVDHLLAIAGLILRDRDSAEDATQEALIRCWRQLPSLRDVRRFDGWLYRILVRAAIDEAKRRSRFAGAIRVLRIESAPDDFGVIGDRELLERGFERLSAEHRAIVVLRHYRGLPLTEIASIVGIPVGTAKSRYHFALSALRAALEAEGRAAVQGEVLS